MFTTKPQPPVDRAYLLAWMKEVVCVPQYQAKAEEIVKRAVTSVPEFAGLRMTAQTPSHHAEGPVVTDHIERMLCVISALTDGQSLASIEEFAREKDYVLEVKALEETIRLHASFFTAYALSHDLGKAETLRFDVREGGEGAEEGFAQHDERVSEYATPPERVRYDKLTRAFAAAHPELAGEKLTAAFYEATGIEAHYRLHDRVGASVKYAGAREALLKLGSVDLTHAKLMTEMVRLHMEVLRTFSAGVDVAAYKAFAAIAARAGLNTGLFLDCMVAATFLDGVLGSMHYENGVFSHESNLLLNIFRSEREAMPERHALREDMIRRAGKTAVKTALKEGGMDPEEVFKLLGTPIGPTRGQVMERIYALVRDPDGEHDFGDQTAELKRRAEKTMDILKSRNLEV